MRLLFANGTIDWGGEKTWALDTATCLAARGHVCATVGREGDVWVERCADAGLAAHGIDFGPTILDPRCLRRFHAIARAFRPDCIVVNISRDMYAGALSGILLGVPVVRHAGLAADFQADPFERLLHGRVLAATVVVGHEMKRELLARYPWHRAERVHVIHIGKDLTAFRPSPSDALRRQLGVPPEALLLGVTSQLEEKKGHRILLEALAGRPAQARPIHLAIIGRGDARAELEARAERAGIADRTHFLGFRRDLPELLRGLDGFVLPSLSEAFPNTLVEAMASRLACVATDLSCVSELVESERNGLLVPPADVAALGRAIARLADDDDLRRDLAAAARRTVEKDFDLEQKTSDFLALIEPLASRRGEPAT